ncbi:MAG TPA: hypothetical protein VFO94_11040 [Gammaproteobacteria bacterium]|nr:hypothetical protein [Gammaproteobacteria bacterium]
MKVRDAIANWKAARWADLSDPSLHAVDLNELRLQWFSMPDEDGWFRLTAVDAHRHAWSAFCRIDDVDRWPRLLDVLSHSLHSPIAEIGARDLDLR